MPYTVGCTPAPLTFTIRPRFDWQVLFSIGWLCFFGYYAYAAYVTGGRSVHSDNIFNVALFTVTAFAGLLVLIRRERIEIYSEQMVWRKTYFGITRSRSAPLDDVLGAEWCEGQQQGRHGKGPDYVEFFLTNGSIKACFGLSFDDFDRMREDIRSSFPELVKRWGRATVQSKDLTLLNLN